MRGSRGCSQTSSLGPTHFITMYIIGIDVANGSDESAAVLCKLDGSVCKVIRLSRGKESTIRRAIRRWKRAILKGDNRVWSTSGASGLRR